MEFISVSSLISDFWSLLFYPFIKFSLITLLIRFVLGMDRFERLKLKLLDKILGYGQKIKYRERLGKAAPIVSVFLFFSSLYLFSIFLSSIESFIHLSVSFGEDNHLSSEMVLNVWRYHPYIEDFSTLQKVVYYKAQESELGTFKLLSTEGLRNLPEMLLRTLIIFILILSVFLIAFLLIKIIKRGFVERAFMVLRAVLVLVMLTVLFVGISFLNRYNISDDYSLQAWSQYESQVLSSGAPPESDIDIKKEKLDEVNEYIDTRYYDFYASLGLGPIGVSLTYTNDYFEFHIVHYN